MVQMNDVESIIKSTIGAMHTEDLIVEAMRDLVKDEIKRYVRQKLDENPEAKRQAKEIVGELVQAKIQETYALMRLGKLGAEFGVSIAPGEFRDKLEKDLASLVEREVSRVMDKM